MAKSELTLHHLNNSRSKRIAWLLEELRLPYDIKFYQRDKKTMLAPPELKAIHPLGKAPVLTDGELILAESGAIIEYLVNKYGADLKPSAEEELIQYTFWLHFAEGSAMTPLLLSLIFNRIETNSPFLIKPIAKAISHQVKKNFITPNLKNNFDFMEERLSKNKWFAGEHFSAADVQMSFPIESAKTLGLLETRPHLLAYLAAIKARPAYLAASLTTESSTDLNKGHRP